MRRYLTVAIVGLAGMVFSAMLGAGCAYRRADRSLVQPLALSKKQFTGEWYYMKTIFEAPYDSGFFNGQGGWPLGSKIRWEITERYLYAFNASPNVRGTNSETTPMAAWPIIKHFDVKYRMSYSTGEPSNVIVEERMDGLPWYQRKYMRVMWGYMAISDWTDLFNTYYSWIGRIRTERAFNVPTQQVKISKDYMSFVEEKLITKLFHSYYNMATLEIPMSSYRVKFRHSFKRVNPNSTYTPKEYTDFMFSKFGNFRKTVIRYHPDRGIVDWSYKFYASRYNVATAEEIKAGTKKPKKIIYYLSPNFPADLVNGVKQIEKSWNRAFQIALGRKDQVFEIRPNAYVEGKCKRDSADYYTKCTQAVTGMKRELGDIRYNFIWWVHQPQAVGLLGYGPSVSDPDTGEIVHGTAYIYGAPMRQIVEYYMTLYDMITGRYKDTDIINSAEYFNSAFGLNGNKPLALPKGSTQTNDPVIFSPPKTNTREMRLKLLARIKSPEYIQRMFRIRKLDIASITASLSRLDSHPALKAHLSNDYVLALAFPGADPAQILSSNDPRVRRIVERYNPIELLKPHRLREMVHNYLAPSKMNMYMANYYDDLALNHLFKYFQKKKVSRSEIRKRLMEFLFVSTTTHEVGHTFGLTHNFKASTDAFNYHNGYHQLAKNGKVTCNKDSEICRDGMLTPLTNSKEEIKGLQHFYRNASIMDYSGEYYDDTLAVGKTDTAAISFIYGGLVEKAVSDPTKRGEMIKWSMEVERRNRNPKDSLKLRHFRFCSDYMVGQDPFCQRFDSGPTAVEIVDHIEKSYDRTYLLRYWRRGRRNFGPTSAFYRNYFNFLHIASIYQDWTYRVITQPGYKSTKDFADKLDAIQKGFNFFMRILATPSVGVKKYDRVSKLWVAYPSSEDKHMPKVNIPLGVGRFFYSRVNDGYYGIFRYRRIGTLYDKWLTLMALSIRSWGYYNNEVNWIYTNFYDLFRDRTSDYFVQAISDVWNPKSPLLFRAKTMDGKITDAAIEPAWHPFLQYNSMVYALALLNDRLSDRTFQDYMRVGIKGSGKSWTPPGTSKVVCPEINPVTKHYKCTDAQVLCFMNAHKTRTYFAVQSKDHRSIAWQMVKRGCELAQDLALLRNSTTNIKRSSIERKESKLRMLETTLTYMQYYVSIFGD